MPAADGRRLRYDDLVGRAAVIEILGVNVHVAALEDVIASKEWADRPKDREALPELRALASAPGDAGLRAADATGAASEAGEPPSPRRSSGPAGP